MNRWIVLLLIGVPLTLFSVFPIRGSSQDTKTGVLRLRVRVKVGDATKGFSRKRFFLLPGTFEQHRGLLEGVQQRPVVTRDCYYLRLGASKALMDWLKEGDCESVYCREISNADVEGPSSVPEFVNALNAGEKEYGSREIALKWLTTNLPDNLRDGFYKSSQTKLQNVIRQAETSSGTKVVSGMTDRNGTAYFTDLVPGNYVVSTLIPTQIESTSVVWNCDVQVKTGDLATEKPYLLSNRKDRNVKCVAVEKPLPACEK